MQHLPVEDAAIEVDAADVRRLVLGRLNGNPPSGIAQGKLDRLEGQFAQLQVAGFASTDFIDTLGVAAFQFGGVPAL